VRRWLRWFGLWTLLGLASSAQLYFARRRFAPDPYTWWQAVAANLPDWYLWAVLSLVVAWLGRRFRVDRANFGRHFFIHLGASLDLAVLHLIAAVEIQNLLHAARGEAYTFAQPAWSPTASSTSRRRWHMRWSGSAPPGGFASRSTSARSWASAP
jgi:hypothetical protein